MRRKDSAAARHATPGTLLKRSAFPVEMVSLIRVEAISSGDRGAAVPWHVHLRWNRAFIINNLVASTLWHRLKCLEPPAGLLQRIQTVLLNFYLDKLHWVPQSVLYLPKEEGGQGLVHLGSRCDDPLHHLKAL